MVAVRTLSDTVLARFVFTPTFNVWAKGNPAPSPMPNAVVYDAEVHGTPGDMYLVAYPDAGDPHLSRHGSLADAMNWGTTFVCVGRDRAQVATLIGLVRSRLNGWTPDPLANPWVEQALGNRILRSDPPADIRFSFTLRYTLTTRS